MPTFCWPTLRPSARHAVVLSERARDWSHGTRVRCERSNRHGFRPPNAPTVSHSEGSLARASPPTQLRVVLMRATMASSDLRDYFASAFPPSAPAIPTPHIEGRAFPVEERFAETYASATVAESSRNSAKNAKTKTRRIVPTAAVPQVLSTLVASLPPVLEAELENVAGASHWCFLPGAPEIARLQQTLRAVAPGRAHGATARRVISTGSSRARSSVVRSTRRRSARAQAGFSDERRRDFADHSGRRRRLRQRALEEARVRRENPTLCLTTRMVLARLRRAEPWGEPGASGRASACGCTPRRVGGEPAGARRAASCRPSPLESLVMHAMLTSPARDPEAVLAMDTGPASRRRCARRAAAARGGRPGTRRLYAGPDPGVVEFAAARNDP